MQTELLTKDNHKQFKELYKRANGYCLNCGKPLKWKHFHCISCIKKCKSTGLEEARVKIGAVGLSTINYQQHLHRKFFGCNALYKYRGLKEDRIATRIKEETIAKAAKRLSVLLKKKTMTYTNKTVHNKHHSELYRKIEDVRNIDRRLLYNILLYYIDYYILKTNHFKTELHFKISLITNLLINIENTAYRTKNINIQYIHRRRLDLPMRLYYYYSDVIDSLISPLLGEIYDN